MPKYSSESCHEAGGAKELSHALQRLHRKMGFLYNILTQHQYLCLDKPLRSIAVKVARRRWTTPMSALESWTHRAKNAGQDARGAFGPIKSTSRLQRAAIMTTLLLVLDYCGIQVPPQVVFDHWHPKASND